MKTVNFTGTVSHATMRPEDLIPVFFSVLEEFAPEKAEGIHIAEGFLPTCPLSTIDWETWVKYHPECASYLLDGLFDAMNEIAPEDHYFGSHVGDGSDYGFWPIESLE